MSSTITSQTYALVTSGIVAEYPVVIPPGFTLAQSYHPDFVASCVAIPPGTSPSNGWTAVDTSGVWTFAAPAVQIPTLAQQASNLIQAGLTIESTSASGLNGLYGTNAAAQSNILAVQVYLQNNGKFPGSSGTQVWLDKAGSPHTFTTTGQFTEFATAIADYVADLTLVAMTNSGTLPATTTTIA